MILNDFSQFFDVKTYNYWVELSALVFLVALLIRFIVSKKFKSNVNLLFGAALICGIMDMTLDILGSVFIEKLLEPVGLNVLVNSLFYVFQVLFPTFLLSYLIALAGLTFREKKWLYCLFIPAALFIIALIINFKTKWIFYIDYSAEDGIYKHGPLFLLYYVVVFIYLALTPLTLFFLRKRIDKNQVGAMISIVCIIFTAIVLQIIFSNILLTGLAISLSCWVAYEKMANASEMVDKITGVFNYNALTTFLNNEMSSNRRHYYYIVMNVESITPINNAFGYRTGNETYKAIGNYLTSLTNRNIWLFRIFNSRFIFACKLEKDQINIISNIKERFTEPWEVYEYRFDLKCFAYYFKDSLKIKGSDEFIEFVNSLEMKVNKEVNGRYIHIDEEYLDAISRSKKIENAIANSIKNKYKGFEVYYQPIYEVASNKFVYAEALLRFINDELGFISPGEFIPIAESSGQARAIDTYVLNTVCAFLREHDEIKGISVNISYTEFFSNPANKFTRIVKQNGIDPKRICFEITETATVNYSDKIDLFMQQMVEKGFGFAIDDFGTGYSNISRVVSKTFGFVKLDRTFLSENDKMQLVLKSIIPLFKEMKIPMVIEGVETKEQFEMVKKFGIEQVQGFYFSRPLRKDKYIEFIKEHNK